MTNPRIDQYGNKRWFNEHGQLHRTDGPALIYPDGDQLWYINGKLHRTDGPAAISADGHNAWYINDELHRTDGPAMVTSTGLVAYYIYGIRLTEDEFNEITQSEEHLNWYLLQIL